MNSNSETCNRHVAKRATGEIEHCLLVVGETMRWQGWRWTPQTMVPSTRS